MEEGVYICTWSQSREGWTLWVKSRPHLRASASTYAEAEERLIEAIQSSGGAMHAVMEFDPALPKSTLAQKYSSPELYLICGDDYFHTDSPGWKSVEAVQAGEPRRRWLDAFYDTRVCRKCWNTTGRRNEKPVTLTYAPTKCEGAFGRIGHDGGPWHKIFSEEFLALLTPAEKHKLQFQPTIRKRGRKFFELVGPGGPPHVAVSGLKISGWRCAECDHRTWGYWVEGLEIGTFVARADLPAAPSGLFTVGSFPEIELAATADRWKELLGRKGTRGIVSSPLGVVPDNEVVRRPELPTIEEARRASDRKRIEVRRT